MERTSKLTAAVVIFLCIAANATIVTETLIFDTSLDPSFPIGGLSAEAKFIWDSELPDRMIIELKNTSTSLPDGIDETAKLLTTISFDLGGIFVTGGSVEIAAGSQSVNFDKVGNQLFGGADVSGEWGFGNEGNTNMLITNISCITAHVSPFGGINLDGPVQLDGPQGGIGSALMTPYDFGGLGGTVDTVIISLQLDGNLNDLGFLSRGAIVEFGSDAAFLKTPEPATIALLGIGSVVLMKRRITK